MLKGTLCAAILLAVSLSAPAAVFDIAQFGGKGDNKTCNLEAFVKAFDALAKEPGSTLKIGDGIYRISTGGKKFVHERYHIIARNMKNAVIEGGKNTRIVFTDPEHGGILFYVCPNLKLKNLSFDWDPLAFTQAVITRVMEDGKVFDIKLEDGFPEADNKNFKNYGPEGKFMIGFVYDPKTRKLFTEKRKDDCKRVDKVEKIAPRTYRITLKPKANPDGVKAGRLFVLLSRNPSNGLVFHACEKPRLNGVTMFSSSHIGMVFRWATTNPVLDNCKLMILPGSKRMLATNADGFFFDGCTRPEIRNCYINGVMDDGIVLPVHGRTVVNKLDDRTYNVRLTWGVAFFKYNRLIAVDARTGERSGLLPGLESIVNERRDVINGERVAVQTVRFSQPVELKNGDRLFNNNFCNQNAIVENNKIVNLRGKGIKVHGRDIVLRNNEIDAATFGGIEIGYQHRDKVWNWMYADNVLVENNIIRNAANLGFIHPTPIGWATAIRIHQGSDDMASNAINRNIIVRNNVIEDSGQSALRAWCTKGITFTNNKIIRYNLMEFPSDTMAHEFINCSDVIVRDNEVITE